MLYSYTLLDPFSASRIEIFKSQYRSLPIDSLAYLLHYCSYHFFIILIVVLSLIRCYFTWKNCYAIRSDHKKWSCYSRIG